MNERKQKLVKKERRQRRVRSKIHAVSSRPRLSVYKSNKFLYAQIIDDSKGKTLVSVAEKELESTKSENMIEDLGKLLAKKAHDAKIKEVVFDRGSYKYHGKIKLFIEAARKEGLNV